MRINADKLERHLDSLNEDERMLYIEFLINEQEKSEKRLAVTESIFMYIIAVCGIIGFIYLLIK